MPRQRKEHHREAHAFPKDFPRRLERLKEESGLTWSEFASRLGTNPLTVRRWRQGKRPNALHLLALLELAASKELPDLLLGSPSPRTAGTSASPREVLGSRSTTGDSAGSIEEAAAFK